MKQKKYLVRMIRWNSAKMEYEHYTVAEFYKRHNAVKHLASLKKSMPDVLVDPEILEVEEPIYKAHAGSPEVGVPAPAEPEEPPAQIAQDDPDGGDFDEYTFLYEYFRIEPVPKELLSGQGRSEHCSDTGADAGVDGEGRGSGSGSQGSAVCSLCGSHLAAGGGSLLREIQDEKRKELAWGDGP